MILVTLFVLLKPDLNVHEPTSGAPLQGWLLTLPANIILGWKSFPGTNTLAYFPSVIYEKSSITLTPRPNSLSFFVKYIMIFYESSGSLSLALAPWAVGKNNPISCHTGLGSKEITAALAA